jgi:hypothetical protein
MAMRMRVGITNMETRIQLRLRKVQDQMPIQHQVVRPWLLGRHRRRRERVLI